MEADEGPDEDGPFHPFVSPDDRLWRHPSEMGATSMGGGLTTRTTPTRIWTVALLAGVVGALLASGVSITAGGAFGQHTTVIQPVTRVASPSTGTLASDPSAGPNWPAIVATLSSSVVGVTVRSSVGTASGSGVVYSLSSHRAYVLTDASLLANGGRITATFNGGQTATGYLTHTDPKTGLALLAVPNAAGTLPTLGTVAAVRVAEPVIAIGARTAAGSVVTGSISGLDQTVATSSPTEDVSALMAVSANALPAANAGGALVDGSGSVIGIATSLQSTDPSQQGLAFAVPIDVAKHIADQLEAGAAPTHPWLGITGSGDLARPTAQAMGLSGGAQVVDVNDPSPASAANIRPNDVITDFDGQPVGSTGALAALLNRCNIGQKTPITYQRAGRVISTSIRVAEQPGDTDAASSSSP